MSQSADTDKVVIGIEGMSCGHCTGKVEDALTAVDGVASVQVSLDPGSAIIEGENLAEEKLKQAVSEAGYEASVQTG